MKTIFNDGQELQIQQASLQADGGLLFKTISATEEQLRTMFSDAFATRRMTIQERNATVAEYENYTRFDAIVKYTAGIMGVLMYKEGESPDDRMKALEAANEALMEKNDMLEQCILEMSELVYQ
ncbi:hypothetical protein CLSC106687_10055 [[Clostridium] scindens]|uniref:Uncharacterized protein n=1 Tax=Clostridium scindens (strain ATCC 35704 / DSM 5676 / VPI 13733 / 19) TaxID=411468 RepID=A0A494WEQ2_CLOS5|nr:hypothetical protein [[Clostridium] scindens]QBF72942.1 hypothetical protein HDCHBGLK_00287 [[Clostridium] scindens ATCC 35704]QRO36306.1 hypothetical protein I6J57_13710 [[Clostridium] scindens]